SLMPLRLARYGVPLAQTAPDGLAAAGIELPAPAAAPAALAPAPAGIPSAADAAAPALGRSPAGQAQPPAPGYPTHEGTPDEQSPWFSSHPYADTYNGGYDPTYDPEQQYEQWYAEQEPYEEQPYDQPHPEDPAFPVPAGPGRTRPLGGGAPQPGIPAPRQEAGTEAEVPAEGTDEQQPAGGVPDGMSRDEAYFQAFRRYVNENMDFPNARQFGLYLQDLYGVQGQSGGPLTESTLRPYLKAFRDRYQQDLDAQEQPA
ncbi:DUF2637 domain-containing protein, partial [Streptomyces sp. NPDC002004]